jgi:2-phospho-L-lactate guanylyltransferase
MKDAGLVMDACPPGLCALVAVKQRARCKMRLAAALPGAARVALVRSMLATVLAAARDAQAVRALVLVSPERDAVPAGIPVMTDLGSSLNEALAQAYAALYERGWREFVILPADLPRVAADEIDALVLAGRRGGFAIAPDAAGIGSNALYLSSAAATPRTPAFRFQFGPGSCQLHLQEAQRLGLRAQVVHLSGLAFDVDTPADLARLDAERICERAPWPAPLRA